MDRLYNNNLEDNIGNENNCIRLLHWCTVKQDN